MQIFRYPNRILTAPVLVERIGAVLIFGDIAKEKENDNESSA